jgi:hypothetical protein
MIDLKGYRGFAFRQGDCSAEHSLIRLYCIYTKTPAIYFPNKQKIPDDLVPSGSVEWTQQQLGPIIKPDYYPTWVQPYLYRNIWESNEWILGRKLFVKPADKYKRFTGFVTNGTYRKKKKGPYVYSYVVKFDNEWRYYISNGKILAAEWYYGDEVNTPDAPELSIEIPNVCCAADFGMCNGKLTCIEVQHPFACGWYGGVKLGKWEYIQWVIDGWIYMKTCTNVDNNV